MEEDRCINAQFIYMYTYCNLSAMLSKVCSLLAVMVALCTMHIMNNHLDIHEVISTHMKRGQLFHTTVNAVD